MARMPGATWLGEQSPGRLMERHDRVCVHTIVGWAPAHAAHFSVKLDGTILQSRDTRYQSGANLDGNPATIAIENEDGGKAIPLTPEQVESNAKILAWAHKEHGVPLQLCPDSKPGSRGLAVHRQGIDGNFVLPAKTLGLPRSMWMGREGSGEVWTESPGKECPRNNKIEQVPDILARAKQLVNGEDDMPLSEDDVAKVARAVWAREIGGKDNKKAASLHLLWASSAARKAANSLRPQVARILDAVDGNADRAEIKALLENLDAEIKIVVRETPEA